MKKIIDKITIWLGHPWMPAFAVLLAVVLTLPILRNGFCLDDNLHRLIFQGDKRLVPAASSPLNLFCFASGIPEENRASKNMGMGGWWINLKAKIYFFRPLSCLSHCLDYLLWPDNPSLMLFQSLLWLGVLVGCTGFFYRFTMGSGWPAGLAVLLYAIDWSHGAVTGFICNRNSLLACFFGMLCLICHNRWRFAHRRACAYLGPLFFILSLLSAEAGIATCAYLAAHALFLEEGSLRDRLKGLVAYGAIVVAWRLPYSIAGFGADNIPGFYVDPLNNPLLYASAILLRAPVYLLGQLGMFPISPTIYIVPRFMQNAGYVFTALLLIVILPLFRNNRAVRFWAAGCFLALLPVCAAEVDERNLLFVGIGAMGLIAQLFLCLKKQEVLALPRVWRGACSVLLWQFIIFHGVLGPAVYQFKNSYFAFTQHAIAIAEQSLPFGSDHTARRFILVNNPVFFYFVNNVIALSAVQKHLKPLASLASGMNPLTVTRPDSFTLTITAEQGSLTGQEQLQVRGSNCGQKPGDRFELDDMTVEVLEVRDGMASSARFRFKIPLDDSQLRWFCWNENGYVPFTLPAVGEVIKMPAAVWNTMKTRESFAAAKGREHHG